MLMIVSDSVSFITSQVQTLMNKPENRSLRHNLSLKNKSSLPMSSINSEEIYKNSICQKSTMFSFGITEKVSARVEKSKR